MPVESDVFGTLGDEFADDLRPRAPKRAVLPSYELPSERRAITAGEVAQMLLRPDGLADARAGLHVTGVFASATALVASKIAQAGRPVLVVVGDADDAIATARDLAFFLGPRAPRPLTLLPNDASPYADVNPDRRAAQLRLATLSHLARGLPWSALVVPVTALARKVVPRDTLLAHMITIAEGEEIDRDALVTRLASAGYVRSPIVEDPGAFAVRGGLIDLWPTHEERPIRVELYGDMVLSIKSFEAEGQRTLEILKTVTAGLTWEIQ